MHIRYILFDFDGTMADTIDLAFAIYNRIAPEYNRKPLNPEEKRMIAAGKPQNLLKQFGMSPQKLAAIILRIKKEIHKFMPELKPYDGISQVVQEIKNSGYRLAIITSNSRSNVNLFLQNNGMDQQFEFIYSGKNIFGKDKVFKRMFRKKNIAPAEVIYIGDETRDIEACKKVGIPIIAVPWGLNNREILSTLHPDQMALSPAEIIRCIENIISTRISESQHAPSSP
ncbi:MAG TPA: HAD-IA family hydrolase [Bacteroidales bacterium]|nr:HAD-IA family hydrolase [Bacteroidales bacterium]HPW78774.1 HAD-IA family hydrolase [Bacteroidales bacterium]HQB56337.1 HAD-IA family hydrolase [Bacteroidales bacterium]